MSRGIGKSGRIMIDNSWSGSSWQIKVCKLCEGEYEYFHFLQ